MTKPSILVIEDDRWLAEQYKRVLDAAGYRVTTALHCLEAVQLIDEIHPSAIVLDVLLTGSTAFTLLHELQSYEDTGKIPIILCTNIASDLSINDLAPYGVKCIVDKTQMLPGDLALAIKSVLS